MYINKSFFIVLLCTLFVSGLYAGKVLEKSSSTVDSPSAPGSTLSYTLVDIYSRLNSGYLRTQSTFTEPTVAPGTPTMPTLNQVMQAAPYPDNTNGVRPTGVEEGLTFWCLLFSDWGPRTGTQSGETPIRE